MTRVPIRRAGDVVAHAEVDDDICQLVGSYKWSLDSDGYAQASPRRGVKLRLHRVVLGLVPGDGLEGDHINGDKLDNRRSNLRVATRQQNGQNVPAKRGARGVTFQSDRNRTRPWRVRIGLGRRYHHVGYFATEEEAHRAADAWYAEHMPFAVLERHLAPS